MEQKGAVLIANILIDLFLTAHILTPINSFPLQPCNYIQEILVPETAIRLISEDIGGDCSLETMYIMKTSVFMRLHILILTHVPYLCDCNIYYYRMATNNSINNQHF